MPETILTDATPAWANGYKARRRGNPRERNPHWSVALRNQWDAGWLYADAELTREALTRSGT